MGVPFVNLPVQYERIEREVLAAIHRVCQSQNFILGREVEEFEREFAAYCQTKHAVGVSSGSDALVAGLTALDIGPGDEVITTPFTFFATAGAIHRVGAKPVFADIDPHTFNLDAAQVNQQITDATKAVIVVHLFGQCADMEALRKVCNDIPIIEDSAQSVGAEATLNGQSVRTGNLGDMATFSFFPAKNLGCFGDGGAVVTNDDELAKKLKRLRNHGQSKRYHHEIVGGNFRLDALQAAILRVKLKHLDHWIDCRQMIAESYTQDFGNVVGIVVPTQIQPRHVWNQYVVRILDGKRDKAKTHLANKDIGCAVYYPVPLHLQPCFDYLGYVSGDFPVSEQACREVLALPVVPEITINQRSEVAEELTSGLN